MALIDTKVTRNCPYCGKETPIFRETNPKFAKHFFTCNGNGRHIPFGRDRVDIADLLDDLDKLEIKLKEVKKNAQT